MFRIPTYIVVGFLSALVLAGGLGSERSAAQAPANGVTALTNVRIIDGTGAAAIERGTVVISNGKITAAGATAQVPAGATRVDLNGKTVMPGMINAHAHVQHQTKSMPMRDDLVRRLRLYASYGITTAVSLGQTTVEEQAEVIRLRDEQEKIALDRARVYTSGPSIRGLKTPEEVRRVVDRYADLKVDRIKTHVVLKEMGPELYAAMIDQTHKRGLRIATHIFTLDEAKTVLERGADLIAHSVRDRDVDQAFINMLKDRNVGYIPTLTRDLSLVVYQSMPAFFKEPFFQRGMPIYREQVDMISQPAYQQKMRENPQTKVIEKALEQGTRNLKLLADGGVRIAMGTDSGTDEGRWQGYFEQVEMEMMVKAGLTPMQAIVAATGNAAQVSRLDHLGTITVGKAADLLVLDANPLQDIRNLRQINSVWLAGRRMGAVGTN
jgi:imidazolonepropionase-like amidohydrolase